jgi:hypothetical protein
MKSLTAICHQLAEGAFEFSRHAFRRAVERNISEIEIRQAGAYATLIEDYPTDKYAPSSLLLGYTYDERPLHLHVSRDDSKLVKIITLYEPDIEEWDITFTKRRLL